MGPRGPNDIILSILASFIGATMFSILMLTNNVSDLTNQVSDLQNIGGNTNIHFPASPLQAVPLTNEIINLLNVIREFPDLNGNSRNFLQNYIYISIHNLPSIDDFRNLCRVILETQGPGLHENGPGSLLGNFFGSGPRGGGSGGPNLVPPG